MCGFVGIFKEEGVSSIDLADATDSINSRGPDMQGIESGADWKVGFNRLSIHDLTDKGMQPFVYEDVTVYMNGEIFNYIELQEEHKDEFLCNSGSDVEIIPFLYKKYGLDFLNRLNGMFAIVLIDNKNKIKYLIRDRFGEKPLFYHLDGKILMFASEVKAIKKLRKLEIDPINIQINFSCWFLPQPLTLYKDTFNVNPGSYIKYSHGAIEEKRWYNPTILPSTENEEEIKSRFIELYKSSISIRLRSEVPVGIFLSGGLDSTSIAKFSHDEIKEQFQAFTAEITGKEKFEMVNTDVEIPAKLSKDLAIKNTKTMLDYDYYNKNIVKIVSNFDEIFVNSGSMVFYALSETAKANGVSVILTGVGGDELFGGYSWQMAIPRKINKIFRYLNNIFPYSNGFYGILIKIIKKYSVVYKIMTDFKVWHAQTLSGFLFNCCFGDQRKKMENRIRDYANKYFSVSKKIIQTDIYNQAHFANIHTLIGAGNYFIDIATMKYSVENRSPFFDYRIFEYMMSIPDSLKIKYGQKGLMRKFLKDYLPEYVTEAKKSGPTMPINLWFWEEGVFNPKIKSFIEKNLHFLQNYLGLDIVKRINADENWLYGQKNSLRTFAVISFIIWCKFNVTNEIQNENITFDTLIQQ